MEQFLAEYEHAEIDGLIVQNEADIVLLDEGQVYSVQRLRIMPRRFRCSCRNDMMRWIA